MKRILSQEDYLKEEFRLLNVTPHITHIRMEPGNYYNVITIASQYVNQYEAVTKTIAISFQDAYDSGRSDIGTLLLDSLSRCGYGVALCHHLDQFDRKLGRIIAKGRLLKMIRKSKDRRERRRSPR